MIKTERSLKPKTKTTCEQMKYQKRNKVID